MIATYEIKRDYDTSVLAHYVGRDGLFMTGFRYREIDIEHASTEGYTTIQIAGLENNIEAEAIRKKIRKKLDGVTVEMYTQPELDVEF